MNAPRVRCWIGVAILTLASWFALAGNRDRLTIAKEALQFKNLPGKEGPLKAWLGLDKKTFWLKDLVITAENVYPCLEYGMVRQYHFRGTKDRTIELTIWGFVGVSADAAHEMLFRQMVVSSLPIKVFVGNLEVRKDGPGDFYIGSKRVGKEGIWGSFMFVRNNIAVSLRSASKKIKVLPLARELDLQIQKSSSVSRKEYEASFRKAEVVNIRPDKPKLGDRITVLLKRPPVLGKGQVLDCICDDGSPVTYSSDRKSFSFVPWRAGRRRIGIAVYDPRSLLSRWAVADIAVARPDRREDRRGTSRLGPSTRAEVSPVKPRAGPDVKLTTSCPKKTIVAGENLEFSVTIQNTSDKIVSVAPLQRFAFLTLHVESKGKVIRPQVKVLLQGLDPDVALRPGQTLKKDQDLGTWFPLGLAAGTFEVIVTYWPDRNDRSIVLKSSVVKLVVRARTPEQEKQYQDFVEILRAGGKEAIDKCKQFLKQHRKSMFEARVRLECAVRLDLKKDVDQIEEVLGEAYERSSPTRPEKDFARQIRARSLEKNGRIKEAISVLRDVDERWANLKRKWLQRRLRAADSRSPSRAPATAPVRAPGERIPG